MRIKRFAHWTHFAVRAFFVLGVVGFVALGGVCPAAADVPVPQKKPEYISFSAELLDFGMPPVPVSKPAFMGEGPLPAEEAALYKRVFALQAAGDMEAAAREFAKIKDLRLRGHVLFQRYMHPTAYTSGFDELYNWLSLYADHPGADRIYRLAGRKAPSSFNGRLHKPESVKTIVHMGDPAMHEGRSYVSSKKRSGEEKKAVSAFKRSIFSLVNRTRPTQAYKKLQESETAELLDSVEYDLLRAQIAVGYLHAGKPDLAYDLAVASAGRSGLHVPMAGWVSGLVSWKRGLYEQAAEFFKITSRSPYASGWTASAGSYWAARSYARLGERGATNSWLTRAADHPRTFYGLLATHSLGRNFVFNWQVPEFSQESHDLLSTASAGYRAMALLAAGQVHLAEAELTRMDVNDGRIREALLSYAAHAGLPGFAMRLGSAVEDSQGRYYDAALYPVGSWKPKNGYKIDPTLIHAIMRQESRFNTQAESPSGAKGLMQLMPKTASFIAGRRTLRSKEGQHELLDPETNLDIAQKYLTFLLKDKTVNGDLLSLLIAYNAGPGNLARWKKQWVNVEDPLLFIEIMPSSQTRAYVERVLANYWIYRLREGLGAPSLYALAEGGQARYAENYTRPAPQKTAALKAQSYKIAYNE